jgi:hypothetical protein
MAKKIDKETKERIVELRDKRYLTWSAIGQQTDLHPETAKKYYLLEKEGEGASPAKKAPSGQTPQLAVNEEYQLLAKRQRVLQAIDEYMAIVEGEEWDYVENDVLLLKERLEFLRAMAEGAEDIDSLNEIEGLAQEESDKLDRLGEEQAKAENRAREKERQKKLTYIRQHCLERGAPEDEVDSFMENLVKDGDIEAELQLVKGQEAMEDLRMQCLQSGIDSQFVETVISCCVPKVPSIAYVRQLWLDAQRIIHAFGSKEFAWFWNYWGRFITQGKQSLWLAFLAWKWQPQPAWGGYQLRQGQA